MRQESPRDLHIWDDASFISATIRASSAQPFVCVCFWLDEETVWHKQAGKKGFSTQLFKERDFKSTHMERTAPIHTGCCSGTLRTRIKDSSTQRETVNGNLWLKLRQVIIGILKIRLDEKLVA